MVFSDVPIISRRAVFIAGKVGLPEARTHSLLGTRRPRVVFKCLELYGLHCLSKKYLFCNKWLKYYGVRDSENI